MRQGLLPGEGCYVSSDEVDQNDLGGSASLSLSLVCESLPFRFSLCASVWFSVSSFFFSTSSSFSLKLAKKCLLRAKTPAQTKGWG